MVRFSKPVHKSFVRLNNYGLEEEGSLGDAGNYHYISEDRRRKRSRYERQVRVYILITRWREGLQAELLGYTIKERGQGIRFQVIQL